MEAKNPGALLCIWTLTHLLLAVLKHANLCSCHGCRMESARSSLSEAFTFTKPQSDVHNLWLLHYTPLSVFSLYQVWVLFHMWISVSYSIRQSGIQIVVFQMEYSSPECIEDVFQGFPSLMGVKWPVLKSLLQNGIVFAINPYAPSPKL